MSVETWFQDFFSLCLQSLKQFHGIILTNSILYV